MSTRKSTLTSPTTPSMKLENASPSSSNLQNTKSLDKTNDGTNTPDKTEMEASDSSNPLATNTGDSKTIEQIQKTNQDTKQLQQRVTRNSPLLLASSSIGTTIKKEPLDSMEHHTNSESEEVGGTSAGMKKTNTRGRKSLKEQKELAEKEEKLDELENNDKLKNKEEKDEHSDIKLKESAASVSVVPPTTVSAPNRLTRKTLANQDTTNTRVTRQRQSSGASACSETPPARSRSGRGIGRGKMPVPMIDATPAQTKRKRSVDVDNTNINKIAVDEPGSKYIKLEVKDADIENEEVLLCSQNTNESSESNEVPLIKIKHELLDESENELTVTIENSCSTVANSTSTTNVGRGRGRNLTRKTTSTPTTSNTSNSPSTRATRQTKQNSPVQNIISAATETKKRRIGSQTRSLLKASVENSSRNQTSNAEDEDSKDSMASTNTDDIVLALIKSEKISMEMDDDNTTDAKDMLLVPPEKENVNTIEMLEETCDLQPRLVVDTDVTPSLSSSNEAIENIENLTAVASSSISVASDSEKAPSLSPSELVSEGVSEISVKQFYKKPKFLENNLGIEEDPKLGNIVQKVAVLETATTSSNIPLSTATTKTIMSSDVSLLTKCFLSEPIEKGSLRYEESTEGKKSNSQDDCNSLSSDDNEAQLLIVEDEEELGAELNHNHIESETDTTLSVKEKSQIAGTSIDAAFEGEEKEGKNLNVFEVADEDLEKDQDQEDELTLEESETISMDNNASINEEIITEIEESGNDIEDLSDLNGVIESSNKLCKHILSNHVQAVSKPLSHEPCELIRDHPAKALGIFTNSKERKLVVSVSSAEDEDNDVLAKIDAELKKIDERNKEKLISNTLDEAASNLTKSSSANISDKESIDDFILANECMDIDIEVKLPVEQGESITKEETILDEVLEIKLDDEKPLIIVENVEDVKDKNEHKPIIEFSDDADSLLNDEKSDNKKTSLKIKTSSSELEAVNGKPGSSHIKKCFTVIKDDDKEAMKSSWITLDLENDDEESLRKKELHLQNLGLVTHKAAEKRRLEVIQSSAANVEASKVATQQHQNNKRNGKNASQAVSTQPEYTGTLKTIIKINRNSTGSTASGGNGRKTQNNPSSLTAPKEQHNPHRRQSLKMTFQKGRARAHGSGHNDRSHQDREGHAEDNYYTIQNETEESHDHTTGISTKKDEKEKILIPEKASSFKFHSGRLCEDQCFYCSGKFGLYDTPCHVGQIKSKERQQKILAYEEKLTVHNCLCDACFRHVDRRANAPSYKKRLSAPGHLESVASKSLENQQYDDQQNTEGDAQDNLTPNATSRKCLVPDCSKTASHSLRRKCIRKSVKKYLLQFDIPTGTPCVWLCQSHYDTVIQSSGCVLCKRRLAKNYMYHIKSDTERLEKELCDMGISVQLGIGTAVCKLCRYFANLLMKPLDSTKSQKAEFVKNYRRRLLQFHNINDGSNEVSEAEEEDSNSNSATHPDEKESEQKKSLPEQNANHTISSNQKNDAEKTLNLSEQKAKSVDSNSNEEGTCNKIMEGDFETAGISTDSSNSSSVSNTDTNTPNEMSKLKAILQSNSSTEKQPSADISNVLRANPNISMRELFPGEEDLGLNFKVPFGGSGSQRTPEGWTRVQTFLQYDEPTRRLWEELQKPYGNQSSFLRHLILLEKYFRNGELVLSASASNNASVYTQTVRQRLNSYDKGHCGGLYMGTGTPKESDTSTSNSNSKAKEIDPKIPTFVINEDEDEEDYGDPDVEMAGVEQLPKTTSANPLQKENKTSHNIKQQLQRSRSLSVDKLTKQLSSNSVTITARPKDASSGSNSKRATPSPQKSLLKDNLVAGATNSSNAATSANLAAANAAAAVALAASTASANVSGPSNSRSILKCNLLGINNKSVEILPISSSSNTIITKTPSTLNAPIPTPPPSASIPLVPETKQQKILDVANKLLGNHIEATAAANQNKIQASLLSSPPELVSLQRRSTGGQQIGSVAGNSSSNNNSNNNLKRPQLYVKPGTSRPPPNVVILPDTLTSQERLQSKTWRPTLMPVEENHNLLNKNGPLYQTADGRRLPALVQVQSGGKPFLISIFDYNRMCILRREKLMRDQMLKASKKREESKQQQLQAQQQQQQHQQPHLQNQTQQQQQLQKSTLQNLNKNFQTPAIAVNQRQQQQQQQQQSSEQQRIFQYKLLEQQQAIIKAATAASQHALRYQSILPKTASSNITTMPTLQAPINTNASFTTPMMPLLANTNPANTSNMNSANSSSSSHNSTSWLWNNFPDANQLLLNGGAASAGANVPKLPQLLTKTNNNPASTLTNISSAVKQQQQQHLQHQHQLQQQLQQQQHQQQQLLLSKIPKSLTVIPQHKLMHNLPNSAASGSTSGNVMKE